MPKDIHILLIEDDPYARDLMTLLLNRDWRTRISGEAGTEEEIARILSHPANKIGAVLVDTEVPGDPEWPFRLAAQVRQVYPQAVFLGTGTSAQKEIFERLLAEGFEGYLLKREVGYALASAVALAVEERRWVLTNGPYALALQAHLRLPPRAVIFHGARPVIGLTPREQEIARLAILFGMAHRDLADELLIRADQVAKYVSSVYQKLGLTEILSGEVAPSAYFEDQLLLDRFQKILARVTSGGRRKTADMATLAFHLLTLPEIEEL